MQILIAIGGAPNLELVVPLGGLIQKMTSGSLTLLVVIKNEKVRAEAEATVVRASHLIGEVDSQMQTRIRTGEMFEETAGEVKDSEIDLVIMSERFQNRFFRRLMTPLAEQVLAHISCPVLIARGQPQPISRVLVCESGRTPSLLSTLIDKVSPLLNRVDDLTVLHVMSQIAAGPGVPGWELRAEAEELIEKRTPEGSMLEEGLSRLQQLNVHLEAKIRHGLVVQEILDEAKSGDYDLVVIGAHSEKGWERFLLDDLAREIINQVDRPLLVIKR